MTTARLEALLAVQALDLHLDQLRHRRATLPERGALARIRAELERVAVQRADAGSARDAVSARQTTLEADLATTERRAAEVSKRLYSGTVSASRELTAMAADIEVQRARASDLEDRVLAVLDELEPLDAAVDALDEEAVALTGQQADVRHRLAEAEAEVDAEVADLEGQREEAAAGLDPELRATYDRMRPRLGGIAVARLVGSLCGGCHLTLPATEIDRIRHLRGDELVTCDQCGRILVYG